MKCEMRACGFFFLICVALVLIKTISAGGPCERTENRNWYGSLGTIKTCIMHSTVSDSKDFSITSDRDVTVEGFYAYDNMNLKYLPNNLGSKFPNLLALDAPYCSVMEVSQNNFEGFSKLRRLILHDNQIEKIGDVAFEHIPAVEYIDLANNKIKKLNGRALASLHKLTSVYLYSNECINENFITPARIAEIYRAISEKCGFTDPEPSSTETVEPETDLMAQS